MRKVYSIYDILQLKVDEVRSTRSDRRGEASHGPSLQTRVPHVHQISSGKHTSRTSLSE